MLLSEFISETLTNIADGIIGAQKESEGKDWFVAPQGVIIKSDKLAEFDLGNGRRMNRKCSEIEFEVAITEVKSKGKDVAIGVLFSNVGANWSIKKGGMNTSLNKIKFSIPMVFPVQSYKIALSPEEKK